MRSATDRADFYEHLEELRRRLLVVIAAWVVASCVAYFFSDQILAFVSRPLLRYQEKLIFSRPVEPLASVLKISGFTGLVAAVPILILEVWLFVAPALTARERAVGRCVLAGFLVLFAAGASFAFFFLVPAGLKVLFSFGQETMVPLIPIGAYLGFVGVFTLLMGALFTAPVFLGGLAALGIVSSDLLARGRRLAFLGSFVLSAILTPTTDVVTQIFVAVPLIVLYELTIWITRLMRK